MTHQASIGGANDVREMLQYYDTLPEMRDILARCRASLRKRMLGAYWSAMRRTGAKRAAV